MTRRVRLVVVYGKIPGRGPAKTRLLGHLTPREAARVQRACVLDTIDVARGVPNADVALAYAPPAIRADARALTTTRCEAQRGRTLGERLEDTIARARRRGYARVVVLGSDSPTVPPERIGAAFRALARAQVVIGPAEDGGFYLIASRIVLPHGVLANVPWSSGGERRVVESALRARGVSVARVAPWYDIDRPGDLRRAVRDARHMRAASRVRHVVERIKRARRNGGLANSAGTRRKRPV